LVAIITRTLDLGLTQPFQENDHSARSREGQRMSGGHSHDDHHDHEGSALSPVALRVRALESLLIEKGYVDPAALDALARRSRPPSRAVIPIWAIPTTITGWRL
jgi:hypothetical protein